MEPKKFLRRVWRLQRVDGFAFLAWRDEDEGWHDNRRRVIEYTATFNKPLPNEGDDLYFAPCLFTEPFRRGTYALPGRWLYADLDEVNPASLPDLRPTVAWETSPGRYQAMWLLRKKLPVEILSALNQRVTYFTEADKGGWSVTKVLRVPGTTSYKRAKPFAVKLLWFDSQITYDPKYVARLTRVVDVPRISRAALRDLRIPKTPPAQILRNHRVSAQTRKLYKAKTARGDRSQRLWQLENLLLKQGLSPEETLAVVRKTVWNKYKGQNREVSQLWAEINKAASLNGRSKVSKPSSSGSKAKKSRARLTKRSRRRRASTGGKGKSSSSTGNGRRQRLSKSPPKGSTSTEREAAQFNTFLDQRLRKPSWLVESIWSDHAHGVLAGEAKTYKSVIATDLAVSIASGTPFLNHFDIPYSGPVLYIQEENDEGEVQDRLRRISSSRGLIRMPTYDEREDALVFPANPEVPLYVYNNTGFELTNDEDMDWLAKECQELRPALIVLDPFYLMTPGVDENSQVQVTPVLQRLLDLKQQYGVGVLIIHHYRKQNTMHPTHGAARMSGTGVFHRWFESAVYVERGDDQFSVRLLPDHRGHAPQGAIRCQFNLGSDEDSIYEVEIFQAKADRAEHHLRLERLLKERDEWSITDLRLAMGFNSAKPLKQMIGDHGYRFIRKGGKRGRPRLVAVRGERSRFDI